MKTYALSIFALIWAVQGFAQAFDDADSLAVPDRATDPSPFASGSTPPYPSRALRYHLVDLHTHAFMDRGMGLLFSGDFNSPLVARNWDDRFSSQINADTLESSGLGLVVVSLYAHPVLAMSRKSSIRQQIADAEEFVRTHPNWVVAKSPREARAAFERGKRILVLSLEGAAGILENEEDYREFIDQKGIRIVTFAHIADDHLTGAALLWSYHLFGNPRGMVASWFTAGRDCAGVRLNPNGLTESGRNVAADLIRRRVWIDLSHAPDASVGELIRMMRAAGQPLLFTHAVLRKYLKAERGISLEQLVQIKESGGILGVVPSESLIDGTPALNGCKDGVFAAAAQFNEIGSIIGDDHVFIGTDFNGAIDHLPPSKSCPLGTTLDQKGFYNISQTGEFWFALQEAGAASKQSAEHGVENFISVWEKVFLGSRR